MPDNKKYFYLKLKDNFFENEAIIMLQDFPNGYVFSDILIKLYLRSLKNHGKLMLNDTVSYTPKMLATIVRHKEKDVKKALEIFEKLGLINIEKDGAIYISEIKNHIGESSENADRKRSYREKAELKNLQNETSNEAKEDGQMGTEVEDKCPKKEETNVHEESGQPAPETGGQMSDIAIAIATAKDKAIAKRKKDADINLHLQKEKPLDNCVQTLPLKNGNSFSVTKELIKELSDRYPAVNVEDEILKMSAWCMMNPKRRKSMAGIMRFINGWLLRASERASPKSVANNFKTGDYSGVYEVFGEWPNDVV